MPRFGSWIWYWKRTLHNDYFGESVVVQGYTLRDLREQIQFERKMWADREAFDRKMKRLDAEDNRQLEQQQREADERLAAMLAAQDERHMAKLAAEDERQ